MKHILLIFACAVFASTVQAQTFRCSFSGPTVKPIDIDAETEYEEQLEDAIDEIFERIIKGMGLSSFNYSAWPAANVRNFQAEYDEDDEEFYVYYSFTFLRNLHNRLGSSEELVNAMYVITAHEFGHQLNGHVHERTSSSYMELEADFFAGKTASKHGIPYSSAVKVYQLCTSIGETSTHPGRADRIKAFKMGYAN
ncbi:MAG: hypothetical protein R3A50_09940 [Saprospiraceae bacterium]